MMKLNRFVTTGGLPCSVSPTRLLFPHLVVRGNLPYGWRRRRPGARPMAFGRVVDVLELGDALDRPPHTLSGGQRQRVALGRAPLCGPRLLLDKPLASLDADLKSRILDYVRQVLREWDVPTLYVTHDPAEAGRLARQTVRLREGRVESVEGAAFRLARSVSGLDGPCVRIPCFFPSDLLSSTSRRGRPGHSIMRTQLRIVAGSLKGRKLSCTVNPNLRPTPQMVREALFSILGDAVPDRPFFDVFAGTGVVGLEAVSRGAASVTFVERDFRLAAELERNAAAFGVGASARVVRADVYRWIERFRPPAEPVIVFLSPPFADYERRLDDLLAVAGELQKKVHRGSVVVLQSERGVPLDELPNRLAWDRRTYGRNELFLWVNEPEAADDGEEGGPDDDVDRA